MPKLLLLLVAILGAGLVLLLWNDEGGTTLGMTNDQFGRLVALGAMAIFIGAGIFGSRVRMSDAVRNIAMWLGIVVLLVGGYQYRYELQDVASRITAGLVPGSPLSIGSAAEGAGVRLDRLPNGHFEVRAAVDGQTIRFMVDTGATTTVLATADAARLGLDPDTLQFAIPVATANGVTRAARAVVSEIAIGPIVRRDLPVLVAAPGTLGQSLLGMNFIGSLSGFDMRSDVMILRD